MLNQSLFLRMVSLRKYLGYRLDILPKEFQLVIQFWKSGFERFEIKKSGN